jgi:glycosyltransferase involved in cell wall biosynthesis
MRIFLSGTSFRPSYGGPARSVSRLALALAANGIDVGVWAPDQSAEDTEFLGDDSRVRRLWGTVEEALENFGSPDVIHDNGIWLRHNHRLAVLARNRGIPRLVSTRGMLEPWAMSHKRLKKKLAWWLYQKSDLAGASCHHATASQEGRGLDRFGWKVPICRIPNGVDMPEVPVRAPDAAGLRTALFVGRLYPVKGLPLLIEAWARVRPAGWRVCLVGPDEGGHRAELEALVKQVNLAGVFEFTGSLRCEALERAYAQADLFVLPSHTENFGMVIGEAMARRLPVLTTRGTPWELLEHENCGWWVPVSVDGIASALADATRRSAAELAGMGLRGQRIVSERYGWGKIAREFAACYEWLLGEGRKPDFVT